MNIFKRIIANLVNFSNNNWHRILFKYSSYLSILFILLAYTGLLAIQPKYINIVHMFILYYVCVILLIRFNPFVKKSNDKVFDRSIAFTSGIILLTTTVAKQVTDYMR
jgi:hypothetical protein